MTILQLPDDWHWQTWHGLPYLTCDLLQDWQHGFFTRQFHPQTPDELSSILQPAVQAFRVKQVHGNRVLTTSEWLAVSYATTEDYPQADGLVTAGVNQAVWTCSADCTPVLIADARSGQVAAVHSGWRGTAQKVVPETVRRLREQGSQLADLRVALGPAIAGDIYQVGKDVALETVATLIPGESREEVLATLAALPNSPVLPDPDPDRVRLDVRRVIMLQMEQLGIAPEQMAIAPYCTYQQPDQFFSYRRDRQKQVQWSGIVSREPSCSL
jgi:YfiH family protein